MSTDVTERGTAALPPQTEARTTGGRRVSHPGAVLTVLSLAQLLISLDSTVITVALPSAQADLGFSAENRQWIVTAYALGFGALLLLGGRLADLLGRERALLVGLAGFAAASALGGASGSFGMLVAARALQGASGAVLAPAALSILSTTFTTPSERARAFGVFGSISAGGGAIGLLLGGSMTESLSWRWSLYVNVPLVALAAVGAVAFLDLRAGSRSSGKRHLDAPGATLAVAGLFSIVFGMSNAERAGWASVSTVAWILGGLLLLAVFVIVERRSAQPLLPLRVVTDRTRAGALLAITVSGVGLFATFLFMTFTMTDLMGYSALRTGVAFLPFIAALITTSGLSTALTSRIATRTIVLVGVLVAAGGLVLFAGLSAQPTYLGDVLPGMLVAGGGVGLFMAPAMGAATAGVEKDDSGVGSALVHVAQQVGGSMGVAALSAIVASTAKDALRDTSMSAANQASAAAQGYGAAFWWCAAIVALGGVAAWALIRPGIVESAEQA